MTQHKNTWQERFGKEFPSNSEGVTGGKLITYHPARIKDFFRDELASYQRQVEEVLAELRTTHELDSELYENSGGGRMCVNCGAQAYEEGEECSDTIVEYNKALSDALKKIKLLKP